MQTNPAPKNPGRPDRKYFVGMPIPAGAGFIAASSLHGCLAGTLIRIFSGVADRSSDLVALLMVSTWRYPSFKQIIASKPRSPLIVLVLGAIAIIWAWSQPVLLILAITYVAERHHTENRWT